MSAQPAIVQDQAKDTGHIVVRRCYDAKIPNQFAAHPDICGNVGGAIDFSGAMNPANVFLFGAHGGLIFEWKGPGVYETHVMTTKAGRGAWIFKATRQAMEYMERMGAAHIWARIHPKRPEVAALAIRSGFKRVCTHVLDAGQGLVVWNIYSRRA